MNYTRLIAGVIVVAGAIWLIVAEQMAGASANAVINARLSTLRAPVSGEVFMANRAFGTAVGKGEDLVVIRDPASSGAGSRISSSSAR